MRSTSAASGKGYAAGRCKEILKAHGVTSALLSLGGNVSALGSKPDGTAWTVAIEDPDGGDYLGTVQIADQCVVTSGGYQRYFEQDGVRYWHILDPETGKTRAKRHEISDDRVGG